MKSKNLFVIVLSIVLMLSAYVPSALAANEPSFPTCVNPQGQVKASYESGSHGVVGDPKTYSGKDTVYSLNGGNQTQCLCPVNGSGIQTNWMKASNLSENEISIFVNQGWILVADGSAWGLDQGTYLAKNISYSCSSNQGGTSSSSSSSNSNDSKNAGASATNSIFSLANTGNIVFIASVFILGFFLLIAGFATSQKRKE